MTAVPPPPPGVTLPDPPSFGWIGDPTHLTLNELDEIGRHLGSGIADLEGGHMVPYAAVAYARREDREKYPWDIAGHLPYLELVRALDLGDTEQDQADAAEAAIEAGEPYTDPS